MERAEFQAKLLELSNLAKEKKNVLSTEEVQAFLQELSLTEEQLKLVYEYMLANKIEIKGYESEQEKEEIPYTREELEFLKSYQTDLKAFKPLSEAEMEKLFEKVEDGDDLAKSKVTEQLLSQVLLQAKEYHGQGLPLEDLVQEGNIGLMLSLEALGLREEGVTAREYICGEIDRAMELALEEAQSVRRSGNEIVDKINRLSDSIQQLTEDLERQVTVEELSAFLDMSVEEIEDILSLAGDDIEMADPEDLKTEAGKLFAPEDLKEQ